MIQRRREMGKPDLSYDLDGDGVVGNRDFVLAKIFDKDQDGKLNQQERKQAEEAIKAVSYSFFIQIHNLNNLNLNNLNLNNPQTK